VCGEAKKKQEDECITGPEYSSYPTNDLYTESACSKQAICNEDTEPYAADCRVKPLNSTV